VLGTSRSHPNYAICCDQLSRALMERQNSSSCGEALCRCRGRHVGGDRDRPAVLRAELYLRQHRFPQFPLDGQDWPALREAVEACFALDSCSGAFLQAI
jgi:hypothetical protein